ncbi:unnamed protein product [Rhizophagus irregularis]|uniref:Uncharacterized protein n=1 Tax=Rhizophagus irregularis TaxID=588596 RepID=A0A915YYB0_9GLOM|nr:unnamed protein product [Rhizophagus irregularis]CAB5351140.1 unnamed protein product [Rhizophagus irregularis]
MKYYANISSELEFLFLFCRALTLNLDLYFFFFFSYPGGEQHCFDYCFVLILAWTLKNFHFVGCFISNFSFGDSNSGFFYYFDSFYLEISFLWVFLYRFQPDFSLGSFVTDNDIL